MHFPLISDLAIILGVAGLVSLLFHRIRQPVVLGYIIAGMIVGPHTPPYSLVSDIHGIKTWAELGVIFLMFSLGLEFSFRKLATVGISAGVTSGVEVGFMLALGFFSGRILGWSSMDSIFLGAMLSISSTTIIIKALDELKLKTKKFAESVFAILIVEDLLAILILVALSTFAINRSFSGIVLLKTLFKLVLVIGSWFLAGYFVLPRFVKYIGRVGTREMLTLFSMSLCLALAVFAAYFDYSVALGAFIMGSILAESTESHKIVERMEPLRDLFAAVFFVSVGMLIDPRSLWQNLPTVLFITAITIVGKIFSTTLGSLISGQNIKSSVKVGFSLAQIGEFSFIIAGLGMTSEVTSSFIYPLGVAVSVITTFTTPYLIKSSEGIANFLERRLSPEILGALTQYSKWIQERQSDASRKKELYPLVGKWFVNGIVVSTLFLLSAEYLLPVFKEQVSDSLWSVALCWLITVGVSAPFIWAMLSTFTQSNRTRMIGMSRTGIILLFRFVTLTWLGVVSRAFWPLKYTILLTISLELIFFAIFYRQIEKYYRWFEDRFLSTFESHESKNPHASEFTHLAPWDAHLVRIQVHPNSIFVSQTLQEAKLRDQYGVNIVIIQRGDQLLVAPKPNEKILPQDQLLVLGNDEQIDSIRPFIEKPQEIEQNAEHINLYEMQQIRISRRSPLVGKTIRNSGIRERFGSMVVGVERNNKRTINPDSDLTIQTGDILWVVGDRDQLSRLGRLSAELQSAEF
jgi:CPA2 family monovalent cation:H+ antiporter-2